MCVNGDQFFKGYIKTKGKRAVQKYKDRSSLPSLEDVQNDSEYAGVLALNTILVDIDDAEQSEIMFQMVKDLKIACRVYATTRGKHFVMYNTQVHKCSTHSTLACGLVADIKVGFSNSIEVLKFDGKTREILYDLADAGADDYQEVPKWMIPIRGNADFIGLKAGDGRNQGLFNYILTLQSNGFDDIEEIRDVIRMINRYVMGDPLGEQELETILRDEAFKKPIFFKGSSFLFEKFGNYLISNCHIKRINNQLHIYRDGIYQAGYAKIEHAMLEIIPNLRRTHRKETLDYLEVKCLANVDQAPSNMIAFRNGILEIGTKQTEEGEMKLTEDVFHSFSPDIVITNRIDWDYNPEAYSELLDQTLNRIAVNDKQIRSLLEEAAGYAFFRRNELGKCFILTGTGSNGKSTYLETLEYMFGDNNVSNLDIKKLSDRFSTIMLFGKLANIGDDISDEFIADTSIFKKVVTGNRIDAEQKGLPKFEFTPYVKLYFSANNIPRMGKGRDWEAIKRRMVIIPFEAKFSENDPDYIPFIGSKLKTQECMEYLIRLGVEGLKRVLLSRKFSSSDKVQAELDEYEESNNPILIFCRECEEDGIRIENESVQDVYDHYQGYCINSSMKPMSRAEFTKTIRKLKGLESVPRKINGKATRIFVKKG